MTINIFKRKVTSVLLASAMLCSFASFTAYAEPDDDIGGVIPGDNTGDTSDIPDNNDIPNDIPDNNDTPDDSPDNNDIPDNNQPNDDQNNNFPDTNYGDSDSTSDYNDQSVNYDADYYNNYYNSVDNNQQDYYDSQYYTQQDPQEIYDPGMTFNEFERATDYQYSTIADDDEPAQMYNSNGSDNQTLDANDWNDLELNLSKVSSDGTGDFSFIKNNNSEQDSNLSVLLFVFGIVFVLGSVVLLIYIITSGIRNRKVTAGGKYSSRNNLPLKNKKKNVQSIKRTPYLYNDSKYDTAQIDISNYHNYSDDF